MIPQYSVKKLSPLSLYRLMQVEAILYQCGRQMAERDKLLHWNNAHLKNAMILCLCVLKNRVYLVLDGKNPVATFQIRNMGGKLWFGKLAVSPGKSGKGIGSFCLGEIEDLAAECGCRAVTCEVYDKSSHAMAFYTHRGYAVVGEKATLKYNELIMEKILL